MPVNFEIVHVNFWLGHVDSLALHVNFRLNTVNCDFVHVNGRNYCPKPTDRCISLRRNAQVLEKELSAKADSFSIYALELAA